MSASRWFVTSIYQHFRGQLDDLYIEFEERVNKEPNAFELRTNGPAKQWQNGIRRYVLGVSIAVKAPRKVSNVYNILDKLDEAIEAFPRCIQIKKYGDGEELYETAILENGDIVVTNMGLLDPASKIALYTVEANYFYEKEIS